jgi:hypothetical protein
MDFDASMLFIQFISGVDFMALYLNWATGG